jgi:hypothetical protein
MHAFPGQKMYRLRDWTTEAGRIGEFENLIPQLRDENVVTAISTISGKPQRHNYTKLHEESLRFTVCRFPQLTIIP